VFAATTGAMFSPGPEKVGAIWCHPQQSALHKPAVYRFSTESLQRLKSGLSDGDWMEG